MKLRGLYQQCRRLFQKSKIQHQCQSITSTGVMSFTNVNSMENCIVSTFTTTFLEGLLLKEINNIKAEAQQ